MAHRSFQPYPARTAFGVFNSSQTCGDYLYNKKAKTTFCVPNKCKPSRSINDQGSLLLLNRSNYLNYYACSSSFNKSNLNINLITKLDLTDVPVVQSNISPYDTPTVISTTDVPYTDYVIDPNGALFGNTVCGINNYKNYMVYNAPYTTSDPDSIDNL